MPFFIEMLVVISLIQAIGARWYNRNLPVAGRKVQNSLSVIAFVRTGRSRQALTMQSQGVLGWCLASFSGLAWTGSCVLLDHFFNGFRLQQPVFLW